MDTKLCTKCKETKAVTEFNKLSKNKDGLNTQCRTCKNDKRNQWRADRKKQGLPLDTLVWKRNNRDKAVSHRTNRRRELRDYLRELRKGIPCTDCGGIFPPTCMDWDHKDPTLKEFNVTKAVQQLYTKERIHAEIEKCELVCSNCHRIRSAIQRGDDPWA